MKKLCLPRIGYLAFILVILVGGCKSTPPNPVSQSTGAPTAAALPTWTSTAISTPLTATATPEPTATLTSTPTSTATVTAAATATPTSTNTPLPTATATPTSTPLPQVVVLNETVNLRAGPDTVYDVVGAARKGDSLPLLARTQSSDWWQVEYNSKEAWVFASLVEANREPGAVTVAQEIPPTPTLQPTSTPLPTPTPSALQSGVYPLTNACIDYKPIDGDQAIIHWCIESVEIKENGTMWFWSSWTADLTLSWHTYLVKEPDSVYRMYIQDNLGNYYYFTENGGASKDKSGVVHNGTLRGWFLFPPPQPGAFSFTFHDDDQCVRKEPCLIENIVLEKPQ